jgi:Tol biopolymer transport system component
MKKFTVLFLLLTFFSSDASAQNQPRPGKYKPELFAPGVITTGDNEFAATFAPDGKTVYFSKSDFRLKVLVILFSRFERGRWSEPEIAPFSGRWNDLDPYITPDGNKLFFASNRPLSGTGEPKKDYDLWQVEKTAIGDWSEPRNLGQNVNGDGHETTTAVTLDGTLYVAAERKEGKGGRDLYKTRLTNGEYAPLESLGDLFNTAQDDSNQYVAPDGSFIIFNSSRPKEQSGPDLYVSYNENGKWTAPELIGGGLIDSQFIIAPTITPDGKYFVYSSNKGLFDEPRNGKLTYRELINRIRNPRNGFADIYRVELEALKLKRKLP